MQASVIVFPQAQGNCAAESLLQNMQTTANSGKTRLLLKTHLHVSPKQGREVPAQYAHYGKDLCKAGPHRKCAGSALHQSSFAVLYELQQRPVLFADAGLEYIIQNGLGYDPHGYFAQPPTLDDIRQVLGIQVQSSLGWKGMHIY